MIIPHFGWCGVDDVWGPIMLLAPLRQGDFWSALQLDPQNDDPVIVTIATVLLLSLEPLD